MTFCWFSSTTATQRRDGLTLDGFCHLLSAIESEIKHSSVRTELHCYVEDSSPLPAGVYREIIELVVFLSKNDHCKCVFFLFKHKISFVLVCVAVQR